MVRNFSSYFPIKLKINPWLKHILFAWATLFPGLKNSSQNGVVDRGRKDQGNTSLLPTFCIGSLPPDYWLSLRRLLTLPFPSLPLLKHICKWKLFTSQPVKFCNLYLRTEEVNLMSNSACVRLNEKNIQKIQKGMSYRLGWFTTQIKSFKLKKIKNWGFYYVVCFVSVPIHWDFQF